MRKERRHSLEGVASEQEHRFFQSTPGHFLPDPVSGASVAYDQPADILVGTQQFRGSKYGRKILRFADVTGEHHVERVRPDRHFRRWSYILAPLKYCFCPTWEVKDSARVWAILGDLRNEAARLSKNEVATLVNEGHQSSDRVQYSFGAHDSDGL